MEVHSVPMDITFYSDHTVLKDLATKEVSVVDEEAANEIQNILTST